MKRIVTFFFALIFLAPASALAMPTYSGIYVYGDSLADNGNIWLTQSAVLGAPAPVTATPIPNPGFIPGFAYDRGPGLLPAFSNGPVWTEGLAAELGVGLTPTGPILPNGRPLDPSGNNYAFAGARMGTPHPAGVPNVADQYDAFHNVLLDSGVAAPADALYVVEAGGNDVFAVLAGEVDVFTAGAAYANDLYHVLSGLAQDGAQHILVANTPSLGHTPAATLSGASIIANTIASGFNELYDQVLADVELHFGIELIRWDVYGLLEDIVANSDQYGLANVGDACAFGDGLSICSDPSSYLFWDGIHATAAGHAIFTQSAIAALSVPEPGTIVLLATGLLGLLVTRRRRIPRGPA